MSSPIAIRVDNNEIVDGDNLKPKFVQVQKY